MVALAENGRIPIDNPTTHLELTMVHEAMILEYSGRHLALIEWAAALKLTMYLSLIACIFFPFGMAQGSDAGLPAILLGPRGLSLQARRCWPLASPSSRSPSPRCGCSASASSWAAR